MYIHQRKYVISTSDRGVITALPTASEDAKPDEESTLATNGSSHDQLTV